MSFHKAVSQAFVKFMSGHCYKSLPLTEARFYDCSSYSRKRDVLCVFYCERSESHYQRRTCEDHFSWNPDNELHMCLYIFTGVTEAEIRISKMSSTHFKKLTLGFVCRQDVSLLTSLKKNLH